MSIHHCRAGLLQETGAGGSAKCEIVLMTMPFAISGISAALFLLLNTKRNDAAGGNFES
jgi:hypothetical protein